MKHRERVDIPELLKREKVGWCMRPDGSIFKVGNLFISAFFISLRRLPFRLLVKEYGVGSVYTP